MSKRESTEMDLGDVSISELLDKLIKLKEDEKSPSFLKKVVYVVSGICLIMFIGLICLCLYKNSFTTESILATLLAFFSIFISIFFYFKADETSTRFYDSSYKFMKDISVTLGKIEERFGEKLNNLNEKVSHLDNVGKEATEEIKDKEADKDNLINELMEKANLSEEEKQHMREELEEREREIQILRIRKAQAEQEASELRNIREFSYNSDRRRGINSENEISRNLLRYLCNGGDINVCSEAQKMLLHRLGIIDEDNDINRGRLYSYLERAE